MRKRTFYLYYWGPVVGFCLLIFIQSSLPTPSVLPGFAFSDKIFHGVAYAVLAALFLRAYRRTEYFASAGRRNGLLLISILSSALYGLSDELHQAFVSARHADLADWAADAVGSVAGAWGYFHLTRLQGKYFSRFSWIDKIINFL